MVIFTALIFCLAAAYVIWRLYCFYKTNPAAFSTKNLNKSFYQMGILAIILIFAVGLVVMLLRAA